MDTAVSNFQYGTAVPGGPGYGAHFQTPINSRGTLVAVNLTLTTDGNAADRRIYIYVDAPGCHLEIASSMVLQPANKVHDYLFGIHLTSSVNAISDEVIVAVTPRVYLLESWYWEIAIDNIQVTDVLSNIRTLLNFWTYGQ